MNLLNLLNRGTAIQLAETLGHFLWQGLALALFASIVVFLIPKKYSNARYLVLVSVFLVMACCPVGTFLWLQPPPMPQIEFVEPIEITSFESATPAVMAAPLPDLPFSWKQYAPTLTFCYLVGVVLMLGRLSLSLGGGWHLRRKSTVVEESVVVALRKQAELIGLAFVPAIAYCEKVVVPTVVGVIKPMVLLPASFATGLTTEQVELVLAHELAHIRRLDPIVNFMQRVIESFLFFHPAVWFLSKRIRTERENCCDDLVVKTCGQNFEYASTLVEIAARANQGLPSANTLARLSPPIL